MSLPEFPTDDYVLDLLLDSMSGVYQIGEDGEPYYTKEFSLNRLLEFFSGYSEEDVEVYKPMLDIYGGTLYSTDDVIRSLIKEVKRLRQSVR